MTIELTEDEHENLLMMLGFAAGLMLQKKDWPLFYSVMKTVNAVGRSSPTFRPYDIPPKFQQSEQPSATKG